MGLDDGLLNKLFGTNVKSMAVTPEVLADLIEKKFILSATSREKLDELEKTLNGGLITPKELYSADGGFRLYVSHFERGLVSHRTVFVKNEITEEVFEWSGYSLGPIKNEVGKRIIKKRMEGFEVKDEREVVNLASQSIEYTREEVQEKVKIIKCPYCAELIRSDDKICPICDTKLK